MSRYQHTPKPADLNLPEDYSIDTSFGLIAFSLAIVTFGTLALIWFTKRSGILEVSQRHVNPTARNPDIVGAQRQQPLHARRAPRPAAHFDEDDYNSFDDDDASDDMAEDILRNSKIGVKKQRRLDMKAEKRRIREIEAQERMERARLEAERIKKEELERLEEANEEKRLKEEEAAREAERKRKEHEEYLALKADFAVEEEGFAADDGEEAQDLLNKFVDFIQNKKVVSIDEVASHFGLRSADCVSRIKSLQESERLTGILDDRGKFIYVSDFEMRSLAKFINTRGRISISELAASCASRNIISLKSNDVELHKEQLKANPPIATEG